jgi:anthranilate synthase
MVLKSCCYVTRGGIYVNRCVGEVSIENAIEALLTQLDSRRGCLLGSSYEYPGRYKRWSIGFKNPPLELSTRGKSFTIQAHNERGMIILRHLEECLRRQQELLGITLEGNQLRGSVAVSAQAFAEEDRSKQPSVFTLIRSIMDAFFSVEDPHLGLYGAFGYDLVFEFEPIHTPLERNQNQRDLLLYLPDELLVIDYHLHRAFRIQYEFETSYGSTVGLPRSGEVIDYRGASGTSALKSDHASGQYTGQVRRAKEYFKRGDLFEVVLSQCFYETTEASPSSLFQTLLKINPSPYGFVLNLGGEYLIGASPEMFVRVEGRRVETCPISGTVIRGEDALQDADRIRQLLNSGKDESELTMCTDVDRNDKSRVCEPGSVQVIGRRQIEIYSRLIHTVDHVEGLLRPEFDALDAFLSHMWAITVTGAMTLKSGVGLRIINNVISEYAKARKSRREIHSTSAHVMPGKLPMKKGYTSS